MLDGYGPLTQALLGTGFTWLMTAVGALSVFLLPVDMHRKSERSLLDISLGFAGGVMLAASYWSLLEPALDFAEELHWGDQKWVPVALGFLCGGAFVILADALLPNDDIAAALTTKDSPEPTTAAPEPVRARVLTLTEEADEQCRTGSSVDADASTLRLRRTANPNMASAHRSVDAAAREATPVSVIAPPSVITAATRRSWRRLMLLVIAITAHNIPEGLAVGVGFGATHVATAAAAAEASVDTEAARAAGFVAARALAIGVGLQNLPEGLAVALPLRRLGYPAWKCFFWGQLSGACEIIAGLLGAMLVQSMRAALPFSMAFAAGAMVVCVCDQLLPEVAEGAGMAEAVEGGNDDGGDGGGDDNDANDLTETLSEDKVVVKRDGADVSTTKTENMLESSESGNTKKRARNSGKSRGQSRLCAALSCVSRVRLCTVGLMVGFTLMMVMDVAL